MMAAIEMAGRTFGAWTVLERAANSPSGNAQWLCRCECGTVAIQQGGGLRAGNTSRCRECAGSAMKDLTGQKFGSLTALGLAEVDMPGSYWACSCECGGALIARGDTLRLGLTSRCRECRRLPDEELSYQRAHERLRTSRGPASDYDCIDCGGMAQEWAYQHCAGDSELAELVNGWGRFPKPYMAPYSADLSHYEPMCISCHRRFDKTHEGRAAISQ